MIDKITFPRTPESFSIESEQFAFFSILFGMILTHTFHIAPYLVAERRNLHHFPF